MVIKMEKTMLEKQGRVLIPKSIREKLGLRSGEEMVIEVVKDEIKLKPLKSIEDFSKTFEGCVKGSKIDPLEIKKIWVM